MANFEAQVMELAQEIERLMLAPAKVTAAMVAAVNKTARAAQTFIGRDTASGARVPQKLIKQRLRLWELSPKKDKNYALLSMLTYSMPAIIIGSARKSGDGVKVGPRFFQGGFERYAARRTGKARGFIFKRQGPDRHPLFEERVYLWDAADRAMSEQRAQTSRRLLRNFESEIKLRAGLFD